MDTRVIAFVSLVIAIGFGQNDNADRQLSPDLVKYLEAIEMYRLIRNNSDNELTRFDNQSDNDLEQNNPRDADHKRDNHTDVNVERDNLEDDDHERDNNTDDTLDELQGRAPNCARCIRARKRQRTTAKPEMPSYFSMLKMPVFNWGENDNDTPKQTAKGRKNKHHKKGPHANTGIAVSGLYVALEEGQYHDGGFLVPVYDSAYVNSHEYKRRRKVHDWLEWADKVEEKTEDPCVVFVICQIGLNPNDFGRLGDDIRRLIRRPTIYLRKIIQRYFTATTFDWTKISFGACKKELRECMLSSDKKRWVDMGFPIEGVFTV